MITPLKIVETIITIVALISVGFFAKKAHIAKKEHSKFLNNIIINLTLPALIFTAITRARLSLDLGEIPLIAISTMVIVLALAYAVAYFFKFEKKIFGSFLLVSAFGNTGYLGYPLAQKIAGNSGLTKAIFYDIFGTVLVFLTIGLVIAEIYGGSEDKINYFKEIFSFPPLIALLAAFIFKSFTLPVVVMMILTTLGGITIPLVMLSVGLSLEIVSTKRYLIPMVTVILLKLIISPTIALVLSNIFIMEKSFTLITVMEAAMPPALLTLVFGLKYELDNSFLAAVIFTLTIASAVSVPLILIPFFT